jgi:hypothetical protein
LTKAQRSKVAKEVIHKLVAEHDDPEIPFVVWRHLTEFLLESGVDAEYLIAAINEEGAG